MATFFSVTNADYNLRQELFSKNIHNRDFYEEKFINWVSQFNMDVKELIAFLNHIKVWIPQSNTMIRSEIDNVINRLKGLK